MHLRIERAPSGSKYSPAAVSITPFQLSGCMLASKDGSESATFRWSAVRHLDEIANRSSHENGKNGMIVDTRATRDAC